MGPDIGVTATWSQWTGGYTDNADGSGIYFDPQDSGSTLKLAGSSGPVSDPACGQQCSVTHVTLISASRWAATSSPCSSPGMYSNAEAPSAPEPRHGAAR